MIQFYFSLLVNILFFYSSYSYALEKTVSYETTKIGLSEAKRFAVNNNYKIRALLLKVDATKAYKNRTKSAFYPKFGIIGGVDQETSGKTTETTPIGYAYGNINLFNGFKDAYDTELANLMSEKAIIVLEREKFLVELDVEEQFHKFLYFRDLLDVKNESLKLNSKHQSLAKQTRSTGMASGTDVMEFNLKETSIQSDLVFLKQGLEAARINLRRLLGEEIGSQIEPVGKLQHQHIEGELMAYLNEIKEHSIPIKIASKKHAIALLNAKKARSKWMPSIDFEAQAGLMERDFLPEGADTSDSSVAFKLVVKMELFSGMDSYWERRETNALKESRASELKNNILMSITEMEESFRELKSIEQRVDLELGNQAMSEKYYKSVLGEYRRGFKNSSDLSSASDSLFEKKTRQINYKFDFLKQRIAFEKSYGAPIKVTVVEETNN